MKPSIGLAEMSPVFTLILIVAVGVLLRRLHVLSLNDAMTLRKFVFNVSLPALTFISLYSNTIPTKALWIIPGVVAIQAIGYVVFRLVPVRYREIIFSGFLGNTGFMGYPVVQAVLGQEALPLAVIYEQTHSFMVLGAWVHKNARSLINPPLVAMVLALVLKRVALPLFVTDACRLVGNSTSPIAMLFVGLNVEVDVQAHDRHVVRGPERRPRLQLACTHRRQYQAHGRSCDGAGADPRPSDKRRHPERIHPPEFHAGHGGKRRLRGRDRA